MKKMFIVMVVVAMAIAACGKKQAPAKPAAGSGDQMAPPAGGSDTKPAEGAGGETPPAK
jgi:predicted small lipoprotein YifL